MCVIPFMIILWYESWYCWPKPSQAEILYIPEQAYAQMTSNYSKVVSRIDSQHGAMLLLSLNQNHHQPAYLATFQAGAGSVLYIIFQNT